MARDTGAEDSYGNLPERQLPQVKWRPQDRGSATYLRHHRSRCQPHLRSCDEGHPCSSSPLFQRKDLQRPVLHDQQPGSQRHRAPPPDPARPDPRLVTPVLTASPPGRQRRQRGTAAQGRAGDPAVPGASASRPGPTLGVADRARCGQQHLAGQGDQAGDERGGRAVDALEAGSRRDVAERLWPLNIALPAVIDGVGAGKGHGRWARSGGRADTHRPSRPPSGRQGRLSVTGQRWSSFPFAIACCRSRWRRLSCPTEGICGFRHPS
jgi:hypothetical protein